MRNAEPLGQNQFRRSADCCAAVLITFAIYSGVILLASSHGDYICSNEAGADYKC